MEESRETEDLSSNIVIEAYETRKRKNGESSQVKDSPDAKKRNVGMDESATDLDFTKKLLMLELDQRRIQSQVEMIESSYCLQTTMLCEIQNSHNEFIEKGNIAQTILMELNEKFQCSCLERSGCDMKDKESHQNKLLEIDQDMTESLLLLDDECDDDDDNFYNKLKDVDLEFRMLDESIKKDLKVVEYSIQTIKVSLNIYRNQNASLLQAIALLKESKK